MTIGQSRVSHAACEAALWGQDLAQWTLQEQLWAGSEWVAQEIRGEPSVPDWGAKHEAGRISFPLPPGGPSWHACSLCATLRVALPHGILLFYIPASAETSQHREGPKFPGPLLTETWLNTNKIAQCQSSPLDFPNSLQLLFMQKLTKLCLSCRHSD